jgi:hypothetical protein
LKANRRILGWLDDDGSDLAIIDYDAPHRHRRKRQDISVTSPSADRFEHPRINRQAGAAKVIVLAYENYARSGMPRIIIGESANRLLDLRWVG